MKKLTNQLILTMFLIGNVILNLAKDTGAQIIPDHTLGADSSLITPNININGISSDRIDGGAIRGANLFHSFQEFNININKVAYFSNQAGIANIFTRITGNNPTNILGKLGVLGNANLYIMNPKGIIFGTSASLDVQSSFLATTANAIQFGEQGFFSASNPNIPPSLTINPSSLLFNQIAAQSITNQAVLQVPTGKSLLLIGGDLNLNGGKLQAKSGNIGLGGLVGIGNIGLSVNNDSLQLNFPENTNLANIYLNNQAIVDTSGTGGGNIQVQGKNISLNNTSQILAQTTGNNNGGGITIQTSQLNLENGSIISTSNFGTGKGGFLNVNATDTLNIIGFSPSNLSGLFSEVFRSGQGGDLTINTNQLIVKNGGSISTSLIRNSTGLGGNLTVNAKSIQLISESLDGDESNIITRNRGSGNAGNLTINTATLTLENGAEISASTYARGNAGKVLINSTDSINATGVQSDRSGIFAGVSVGATGKGGDIIVNTKNLSISNGGSISVSVSSNGIGQGGSLTVNADNIDITGEYGNDASLDSNLAARTRGFGNAGQLNINTKNLVLRQGGNVSASTFSSGNAGTLSINASESIQAIGGGVDRSGIFARANITSTGKGGDITINTPQLIVLDGGSVSSSATSTGNGGNVNINAKKIAVIGSGNLGVGLRFSNLSALTSGSGNAGNLTINAEDLTIKNGATVIVNGDTSGKAGNLEIAANTINLDGGFITAATAFGESGNINLKSQNLQMRHQSQLSATAGGNGNGGNIRINTNTLVNLENSNITANAFQGKGGNILITAQGIFSDHDSLITASSEKGINGVVEVKTLGFDVKNTLTPLTGNFLSADQIIAGSCLDNHHAQKGSFIATGSGGLMSIPEQLISDAYRISIIKPIVLTPDNSFINITEKTTSWKIGDHIVEAEGISITPDGRKLLGVIPTKTINSVQHLICNSPESSNN